MPAARWFGIFLIVTLAIAANLFLTVVRSDYREGRRQRQSASASTVRHEQPEPAQPKEPQFPQDPSLKYVGDVNWETGRGGPDRRDPIVRAVDVTELTPPRWRREGVAPTFELWCQKIPTQISGTFHFVPVVDEKVFTDLRLTSSYSARLLEPRGKEIGSVKLKEYDPADLALFLIRSDIIEVGVHLESYVKGKHYTSNYGEWFELHGEAHYATSVYDVARADFGIHIAPDGLIRLTHIRDVGRPLPKD